MVIFQKNKNKKIIPISSYC